MTQTQSIEQARSSSLPGSMAAMVRAAGQARRIAAQTHTAMVIERNGVLEHLQVAADSSAENGFVQRTISQKDF